MLQFFIENSQEILNLVLSFSAIVLTLVVSLVLIRLFATLGILNDFILDLQDTLEIVQSYLWQPARIFMAIKEKFLEIFSFFGSDKKTEKK